MYNHIDVGYLLTLTNLSSDQLNDRRNRLIALREQLRVNPGSLVSDGSMLILKRIETIEVALAMLTSQQDLKVHDPLPANLAILKSGEQFKTDYPEVLQPRITALAPARFNESLPVHPGITRGWAQHASEYGVDFSTESLAQIGAVEEVVH